jgi:rhodanese-related sulfurtransferase
MNQLLNSISINSEDLEQLLKERTSKNAHFILIDVREAIEYKMGHVKGVDLLRPTSEFQDWAKTIIDEYKDQIIILTCRSGSRSGRLQRVMKANGHPHVINHAGGILSYHGKIEKGPYNATY